MTRARLMLWALAVAASWLAATLALNATLPLLRVTPGGVADHLE
jgi:hypothetical protein